MVSGNGCLLRTAMEDFSLMALTVLGIISTLVPSLYCGKRFSRHTSMSKHPLILVWRNLRSVIWSCVQLFWVIGIEKTLGVRLKNSHISVPIFCDNTAAAAALASWSPKSQALKTPLSWGPHWSSHVRSQHVPGRFSSLADFISRRSKIIKTAPAKWRRVAITPQG